MNVERLRLGKTGRPGDWFHSDKWQEEGKILEFEPRV